MVIQIESNEGGVVLEATNCGPLFGGKMIRISDPVSNRTHGLIRQYFENGHVLNSKWQVVTSTSSHPNLMICIVAIVNKSMGRIKYAI